MKLEKSEQLSEEMNVGNFQLSPITILILFWKGSIFSFFLIYKLFNVVLIFVESVYHSHVFAPTKGSEPGTWHLSLSLAILRKLFDGYVR